MRLAPSKDPVSAAEFQYLASMLRKSKTSFESTIFGTSMESAIPYGARIKIRSIDTEACRVGQIVACATGTSMFAHRVVHCGHDPRSGAYVVTKGDRWVLCDSPTRRSAVMGEVTEYLQGSVWRPPGQQVSGSAWKRTVGWANLWLIRLALDIHLEFARRVAGTCLAVGALCKRLSARWSRAKIAA